MSNNLNSLLSNGRQNSGMGWVPICCVICVVLLCYSSSCCAAYYMSKEKFVPQNEHLHNTW
jgi:hypothetical protein